MKISQKLLILFLFNALVPVGVVAGFSYFNTARALQSQIDIRIGNVTNRQAARIKSLYETNTQYLGIFPTVIAVNTTMEAYVKQPSKAHQDALDQALTDTHRFDAQFRRIHVLDTQGTVVGSTDTSFLGKSYAGTTVFKRGHSAPDASVFFTDVDHQLAHYIVGPLNWGGRVIGYSLLEAPAEEYLLATQDYSDLGETGETLLLGKTDSGSYQYLTPGRFDDHLSLATYTGAEAKTGKDYRSHQVLSVQRDITGSPWRIEVKMDRAEVFYPLIQLRNLTLIISLVTVALIIVLALFFARRTTGPIRRFTHIVKRIQAGDYNLRVPVAPRSRDEIATLGLAFNAMTDQLAASNRALEQKVAERTHSLDQKVQELQNAKAKDDAILDSIGDGMLVTDSKGTILLINNFAIEYLGVDKDKAFAMPASAINLYDEKDVLIPPEERPMEVVLRSGKKIERAVRSIRSDGAKMAIAVVATPVQQQGRIIGAIQTMRDITKDKEIDRMKTEFISLASHQLRTPLSAIRWFSEMLMNGDAGKLNDEQADFVKNVHDSGDRMIELVNSLLNISRIESGRIIIDPKPTDVNELVSGVINDLKAKSVERQQTLIVSVHEGIPQINLDARMISQVYMNFLTNAIKYTPKGGEISVFISLRGNELLSQISDNGYGIPKAQQDRVFQKFFRATNIVPVETDGTGLGLYLVKAVIEAAGGRVWFKSEEGKGTTFWFTLPMSGMKPHAGEVTLDS